jgi:hypothetical protein
MVCYTITFKNGASIYIEGRMTTDEDTLWVNTDNGETYVFPRSEVLYWKWVK